MTFNVISILIATAVIYGYLAWLEIWFKCERPVFMPFSMFVFLCSLGKKIPHGELNKELNMDRLKEFRFVDSKYRAWFEYVVNSGFITRLQYFVFNKQQFNEINDELKKRSVIE